MISIFKKIFFIFFILSFANVQSASLECALNCSVQDIISTAKRVQPAQNNLSNHQCCDKSKENKDKEDKCLGHLSDSCLHELGNQDTLIKSEFKLVSNVILIDFYEYISYKVFTLGINNRFKPRPNKDIYLVYKSRLDLYLIKDQFLI